MNKDEIKSYWKKCLTLSKDNIQAWDDMALELLRFQYNNNGIYRAFANHFINDVNEITSIENIPFLPISFFKTHTIVTPDYLNVNDKIVFQSSGTTSENTSSHYLIDEDIYKQSSITTFEQHFGSVEGKVIVCLLPSYLERGNSSLVYMCDYFIRKSKNESSGFYLYELENLHGTIKSNLAKGREVILIGVSYALIDFATAYPDDFKGLVVIETGGMKGKRAEWTKQALYDFLRNNWNLSQVYSEYGMTELLSQSYSIAEAIYKPALTKKILIRDINDPLHTQLRGSGLINIIDLANIHSCAFIATDDLGTVHEDGTFEIIGRRDHAILRGCNTLIQ